MCSLPSSGQPFSDLSSSTGADLLGSDLQNAGTAPEPAGDGLRQTGLREDRPRQATIASRSGLASDTQHGAVVPPIHLSSTFTFEGFGKPRTYDYTRSGNPTRNLLADALADLEGGAGAVVTATGMSAVHLALQLLSPGDLLVAPFDCYGGTHRLLTACAKKGHFEVDFVDLSDPQARRAALDRSPALVWVETPSNPLLRITDIAEVCTHAQQVGARVAVDNTFLSPALQRPLDLGADLVIHSTTKYLNGHSDVVGGAVVAKDSALAEDLAWWANCLGITGSPFDSYLTLRGVRTLFPRMRAHEHNAQALVSLLVDHPAVAKVFYPGLVSHPGHDTARRQQKGFGAMVSFQLQGGQKAVEALLEELRHFSLAESLGGVESLIAHPATMTHAAMDPEARKKAGIDDGLLRISVGIEHAEDLCSDLGRALDRALRTSPAAAAVS